MLPKKLSLHFECIQMTYSTMRAFKLYDIADDGSKIVYPLFVKGSRTFENIKHMLDGARLVFEPLSKSKDDRIDFPLMYHGTMYYIEYALLEGHPDEYRFALRFGLDME